MVLAETSLVTPKWMKLARPAADDHPPNRNTPFAVHPYRGMDGDFVPLTVESQGECGPAADESEKMTTNGQSPTSNPWT
jgi:hypothetical protein